jgi:hypothetical protein
MSATMSPSRTVPAPSIRRAGRIGGQAVTQAGSTAVQRVLRRGGALAGRLDRFPRVHDVLLLSIYVLIPFLFDPSRAEGLDASFELHIRDPAGGDPDVSSVIVSGGTCRIVPRRTRPTQRQPPPRVIVTAGADDLVRMASGDIGWPQLVSAGRMELWGDPYLALRFPLLFGMPAGRGRPAFLNLLPSRGASKRVWPRRHPRN